MKSLIENQKTGQSKTNDEPSFAKKVFAFVLILIVIAVLYVFATGNSLSGKLEPITVRNIFIDVDGDGALDFVTYIEYVPNSTSSIVFPDGQ